MPACVPPPPATSSPDRAAVLVTRPEPGAGETAARITALGLQPIIAPLLMIAPRHATLPPSARLQAIVATSRNAIPALPASHRHLPLFAVGAATARQARAAGFQQVTSADADAEALAALLAQACDPLAEPLLLATGQDQGKALAANLRTRGFRVVRRVVYAAVPATILPEPIHRAFAAGTLSAALFFSAETAKTCVRLLQARPARPHGGNRRCPGYRTVHRRGITASPLAPHPRRRTAQPGRDARAAAMSEPAAKPSPEPLPEPPPPEPVAEPPIAAPPPPHHLLPWLSGIGFVVLAVGLLWVWQHPRTPLAAPELDALTRQLDELQSRLASLERRPAPNVAAPDLAPIAARLKALEQRPADVSTPPDLAPLAARISALEQRKPPDLAPLQSQIATLANRDQTMQADVAHRLDADETRLTALEKAAGRAAQIQAARIALNSGQPLGTLQGAPPALARFAAAKPPTEAQLSPRLPPRRAAALAASRPATDGLPLLDRIWLRAQDLVTIRQGDRVIVGDAAAGVLARARGSLDAGDLAGAVTAVASLTGPAAQPMADWLAQARALLDARAALAAWATQG